MNIQNLLCENLFNPSGITEREPRFNWNLTSDLNGDHQTAWQVLVASSLSLLTEQKANYWNSGKQIGEESLFIRYAGKSLSSSTRYYWKARVWDSNDIPSEWSTPATFVTGIFEEHEWKAKWIGASLENNYPVNWELGNWITCPGENFGQAFYRLSFELSDIQQIQRAVLLIDATHTSSVYLNGKHIKKHCAHWVGHYEIELDFYLKEGKNVLGIHSSNSFKDSAEIFASLLLELKDGKKIFLKTGDEGWKVQGKWAPAEWAMIWFSDFDWQKPVVAPDAKPYRAQIKEPRSIKLEKDFYLKKRPSSAIAHVSGLGSYQLFINNKKVGDELLSPGWTEFDQKVEYQTFDIARFLKKGENKIEILLGNAWWLFHLENFKRAGLDCTPKAIFQANVLYDDRTTETILSDPTWKAFPSQILENSIWHGEVIDYSFKSENKLPLDIIEIPWHAKFAGRLCEPIRAIQDIRPVTIKRTAYGSYILDFGQNIAGWIAIKAPKIKTEKILVQYSEDSYPDGSLNTQNLRRAKSRNLYLNVGANKSGFYLEPHFTYHGFRYAEIFGYPQNLSKDKIFAKVIHTDLRQVGDFKCSNELFNKMFKNQLWTFKDNFYAVPTDCPQRDERLGWMADAGNIPHVAALYFDILRYFDKWAGDMDDAQAKSGYFPDFAPAMGGNERGALIGTPGWADAGVNVPFELYRYYGDKSVLQKHYDAMKKHVDSMLANSNNFIYEKKGWGDWLAVEASPSDIFGTAFFYASTKKLAYAASILGYQESAEHYTKIAENIASAFHKKYYNPETGDYVNGTQTMNTVPLIFGITPPELKEKTLGRIIENIKAHENHFTTGFLGTTYLFRLLGDYEQHDLIYKMLTQTDFPSFGRIIEAGATTMTEAWNAFLGDDLASHNHFNLGAPTEWFFRGLAGIRLLEEYPAFKRFKICPAFLSGIDFVKASFNCPYGKILVEWARKSKKIILKIEIPVGTTAELALPAKFADSIRERVISKIVYEQKLNSNASESQGVFILNSGSYNFELHE